MFLPSSSINWASTTRRRSRPVVRGVTPQSAIVKAKLVQSGLNARLIVSTDRPLKSPAYSGPVGSATNNNNVVEFPLTHLKPNTHYFYALEIMATRQAHRESSAPFPEEPSSFSFGLCLLRPKLASTHAMSSM